MVHFLAGGKTVDVFPGCEPGAPLICLNTFSGEGQKVFEAAQAAGCPPFSLAAVSDLDWNRDMVPWDSPPAFPHGDPCIGGADEYLRLLAEEILPAVGQYLAGTPRWRGIAGYSLAGLFALYALYRTDLFSRAASVSGSLWFPGIKEYLFSHEPKHLPEHMYFSLGSKESKARNPALRCIRQNTEEIRAFYQTKGGNTVFQLNPGNHYDRASERTAAGIVWLMNQ